MSYLYVNTKEIDDDFNNEKKKITGAETNCVNLRSKAFYLNNNMFRGKTSSYIIKDQINKAVNACEDAVRVIYILQNAAGEYELCEKNLKNKFAEFDESSVKLENQIREFLGLDSIKTIKAQKWENVGKIVVGVVVIAAAATIVYFTGGAVLPFLAKTAVGTGVSAIFGGINEVIDGGSFMDGFADGFLSGAVSSSVTNMLGASVKVVKNGATTFVKLTEGMTKAQEFVVSLGGGLISTMLEQEIRINVFKEKISTEDYISALGGCFIKAASDQFTKAVFEPKDSKISLDGIKKLGKKVVEATVSASISGFISDKVELIVDPEKRKIIDSDRPVKTAIIGEYYDDINNAKKDIVKIQEKILDKDFDFFLEEVFKI